MPPQQGQCPFCQLIDNPDQLLVVGETENFYAWLEINPRAKGHTMIVPKEHRESLLEFSPEEYDEAMRLTRRVIGKAEEGLGADGASVTINIGEAGGQMVPHAYIQVFPRFQEDEQAGTPTGAIFPQREELQQQLQEIHGSMESASAGFEEETHEPHPESQRFREPEEFDEISEELEEEEKEDKPEKPEEKDRASRIVDREEMEAGGKQDKEPERQEEEKEESREDQEKDDKVEGEGHWDGQSFEWR